jgi:hypothetical protein
MKRLSGHIRTLTDSVVAKAEAREVMMAVVAEAALAVSMADLLSRARRHRSRPRRRIWIL